MTINLDPPAKYETLEAAVTWVWDQLKLIEGGFNSARTFVHLKSLHAEPAKLKTGLVVLADGTDWDPGTGEGVYVYYADAWHKLG